MNIDDYEVLEARGSRVDALSGQPFSSLPKALLVNIQNGENPVRAIRRYRLLTQRELSELSGLGKSHISNIENGAQFSIRTAKKLAQALGVWIDDIS